jgi:hypothetical protein
MSTANRPEGDVSSGEETGTLALDPGFAQLLCGSYARLVGKTLYPVGESPESRATWLYHAPFGLLAHDNEPDPRFVYANLTAQRQFEYCWPEFTSLRSRNSAEPDRQEDREWLLTAVNEFGFVEDYRGVRIAKSGRRFWIEDVTMWNLVDTAGHRHGQAALFPRWRDATF